jgi:hypothetical protein
MTTWQILMTTIPHRHAKLAALLERLDAQMQPGVTALIYRDNLEVTYEQKLQALVDEAHAEYVSVLQCDDSVSADYVPRVLKALESRPDYVGYRVRYTEAGVRQMPVIHSLACGGWHDSPRQLQRDLCYFNPIRLELARQVRFRGPYCDTEWADDLRALRCVRTEEFIDDEIFWYQRDPADNFHTPRQPVPEDKIPDLPSYPWLERTSRCS